LKGQLNGFVENTVTRGCCRARASHLGVCSRLQRLFGRLKRIGTVREWIRLIGRRHGRNQLNAGRVRLGHVRLDPGRDWLKRHGLGDGRLRLKRHGLDGRLRLKHHGLDGRLRLKRFGFERLLWVGRRVALSRPL
jgi:hypothetical protein